MKKMKRIELIEKMKLAERIHLKWARYQEHLARRGKVAVKRMGSASWHRRWVLVYREVIIALGEQK